MILRDKGLLFIHIPKTAGSTIERHLYGDRLSFRDAPNYEIGWGWCPDRKVWLQHLTLQELVDLDLVDRSELGDLFKFTIVRNPFALAVSEYYELLRYLRPPFCASFGSLLSREGRWQDLLADQELSSYRGDHLRSQFRYLSLDDAPNALDHVGSVEHIDHTFDLLERITGDKFDRSVRENRAREFFKHYSHFYRNFEISMVAQHFAEDISRFDYTFDDRRTFSSRRSRLFKRVLAQVHFAKPWIFGRVAQTFKR